MPNNPMNHSRSLEGSRPVIMLLSLCCKSAFPGTSGHLVSTWALSWGRVEAVFWWNWVLQVLLKGKGWEDRCQLIGWFWAPAFTRGSLPAPPGILWEEGERKTRAWNSTWRLLHSNPVLIKGPGKPGRCDPGFKAHLCSKSVSDAN